MGMALSARRVAMALCASASFRGALTHVQPRYDSLLNWTLSSSMMVGLQGPAGASVDDQKEVFFLNPKRKKNTTEIRFTVAHFKIMLTGSKSASKQKKVMTDGKITKL